MRAPSRSVLVLSLLAGLAAACTGKDPYAPGNQLGTFHVEAQTEADGCGPAIAPPNPWSFDVKLSREGRTLYWIQGRAPVAGTMDATGHATLSSSDSQVVHAADARSHVGACEVTRTDTLVAAMTSGPDGSVESFTGTLRYAYAATEGSDCTDTTSAGGGDTFTALPCEVRLSVTGTKAKSGSP